MATKEKPAEHCVEIYVRTECRCGKLLPEDIRAEVLEDVKSTMADWFGGGTKANIRDMQVEGFFRLASNEMANEANDVVFSNTTAEALEEHHEELLAFTAGIANRLTQEETVCRVKGAMYRFPATADPKPHRCAGGVSTGELPTPLQPDEKARMRALQASLQRISSIRDARDLFCNVLHYAFEDGQLATVKWPDKLRDCLAPGTAPLILADQNGFKILYLQLAEPYLRKGHERQLVQRIIKDDPTLRGLVVVSDVDQKEWHLVNAKFEKDEGKNDRLRLRRMRVGTGQSVRTAVERLAMVDIETAGEGTSAAELQDLHDRAFDVESVSKEFFNDISNWYFWALSQVEFPTDTLAGDDDEKHRATSLIRFLTRMIFCWFLKEKDLIPPSLFREKDLADILVDLDDDSCSYHQGILQNLFFATLNQRMGKDSKGKPHRAFAKDEGFPKNKSTYGVDTLYRYEEHFQDPDKALSHFADVPFLNGGLFECLDRTDEDSGKRLYVDGFSRNKKKRARVPNRIFFARDQTVDLSEAYGDKKRKNAKVRGLLRILHAYNFTVEENTPIDEEIALDPELLGKVFENLLASYNEETKTTARKQTGSFYTPRPIVEYMVDESLKAHLAGSLVKLGRKEEEAREQLDLLLGYTDEEPSFSEEETNALLEAIHSCKILDPACGSGAFPIGMLQKLVYVVHKLDPGNTRWKQLQIDQASKIPDSSARAAAIKAIKRDFEENGDDYGRKLYLIENCLYGVDIQPIAIQISKLRFFISLICDQKTSRDKAKNHGIRPLPNLETKFVAANTLIGLPGAQQLALVGPRVNEIETEIESLYHRHFSIQRRDQKLSLQKKLKELRKELGQVLAESLGSSQKAQLLADWDPFDSQKSSNFFDPHWMFGRSLADGFHIIIGNPPFGATTSQEQKDYLKSRFASLVERIRNSFLYFLGVSYELATNDGVVSLILPNEFLFQIYMTKARRFFLENAQFLYAVNIGENAFDAIVPTCIISIQKLRPSLYALPIYDLRGCALGELRDRLNSKSFDRIGLSTIKDAPNSIFSFDVEAANLVRKLISGFPNFENYCDDVANGISTSCDSVYIVSSEEADSRGFESQFCKPCIRGGQFSRHYCPPETGDRVLYITKDFDASNGPRISEYLADNKALLTEKSVEKRKGNRDWRILFRARYPELFRTTKIIIRQTGDKIVAAVDDTVGYFCIDSVNVAVMTSQSASKAWYLSGLLNSRLLNFVYREISQEAGRVLAQVKPQRIRVLPIAETSDSEQASITDAVRKIAAKKAKNPDANTSELEEQLNQHVYRLYNLTEDEIKTVEKTVN